MNHTEYEFSKVPKEKLAHGYRFEENIYKEETLLHHGSYGIWEV